METSPYAHENMYFGTCVLSNNQRANLKSLSVSELIDSPSERYQVKEKKEKN